MSSVEVAARSDVLRPTGKAYGLSLVVWVVVVLSFALLRWSFVSLCLPVLWLLFLGAVMFKPEFRLEIRRVVPHDRILEGREVTVKLVVKSTGRSRLSGLIVVDDVPEGLEVLEEAEWRVSMKPGEERELEYRVRMRRGIHVFERVRVIYTDPFGLFHMDTTVDLYDEIIGVPIIEDTITPYSTKGTKVTVGPLPSPRVGEGVEFHAIRDYQPGDPFKIINWKATARTGRLMVNEFESERKVDVIFVVDAGYRGRKVFDYLVRGVASLMLNALNDGTSFGLLLAERVPLWIRIDYGKRHFFKCIDFLSSAGPDVNNMIAYQVEHLIKSRFPPMAQIVYFSPLMSDESVEALRIMSSYGYRVVVISPDPYSLYEPKNEEEELALRLLRLRRRAMLKGLMKYGVIVNWDVRKPFKAAIASAMEEVGV
ncbi:MAG: DUF58 domain-containing protein [Thermococci archaeon]|nr:DUF58 domain-containing protein [Thermococci archaeon]